MKLVKNVEQPQGEPLDRLGRLAEAGLAAIGEHPEFREGEDRILIMVENDVGGTTTASGYDHPRDTLVTLLSHAQALAQTIGVDLDVLSVPDAPPEDEPTPDA